MGHPSKLQRVSRLGFVTAPTSLNGSQPNFAAHQMCMFDLLMYVAGNASENVSYILAGSDAHRELWMVRLREVIIFLLVSS